MKIINSLTSGNYERDYFKLPLYVLHRSLLIFIIIFILIFFKLSYVGQKKFIIQIKENNLYQVIVPYQDIDLWLNSNKFLYNKKKYTYDIKKIERESIMENNKVYLPVLIETSKLSTPIPLIEVSLEQNKMTLWDYLKEKVWRK